MKPQEIADCMLQAIPDECNPVDGLAGCGSLATALCKYLQEQHPEKIKGVIAGFWDCMARGLELTVEEVLEALPAARAGLADTKARMGQKHMH